MLDLSGKTLGQLLAAALAPTPPTPVAPAPNPGTLPPQPPPTSAQQAAYKTALAAYQAYQGYLGQLAAYNQTVKTQADTFTTMSSTILTYLVDNTVVLPTALLDGYGRAVMGTGEIS